MARMGYGDDMYNLPRKGPTEEIQAIRDFCTDIYTYLFPERMYEKYRLHRKFRSLHFYPVIGDVVLLHSRQCMYFFGIRFLKDYKEWRNVSNKAVLDYMEKIAKDILANNTGSTVVFLLVSMILELVKFIYGQGCSETFKYGSCMYLSYIFEKYCMTQWNETLKHLDFREIASAIHEKYFDKQFWEGLHRFVPFKRIGWTSYFVSEQPDDFFEICGPLCAEPVLQCTLLGNVPTYEVPLEHLKIIRSVIPANPLEVVEVGKETIASSIGIEGSFQAGDALGTFHEEDVDFTFGKKFYAHLYGETSLDYRKKLKRLSAKIPSYINTRQSYKKLVESKVPIYVLRSAIKLITLIEAASSNGSSLDSSRLFLDILEPCRDLQRANLSDQIKKISALSRQASEIFLRIVNNTIHLCHKIYGFTKRTTIKDKAIKVQNIMFELIFDYKDTEMYSFPPMNFENDDFPRVAKKVMMCYFSLGHLHLLEVSMNDTFESISK